MSFKLLEIGMDALRRARIGRAALVAAALCVATAPSPSYADKTISENTTLTEDTDWSGEVTVTIADGVTFSPDAATRARFRVVPETNGLRVSFKGGFCIIIK